MMRSKSESERRFKFHWASLVIIALWLIAAGLLLYRGDNPASGDWYAMGQRTTRHFGLAAIVACVSYFVFRRSSRAANIAFSVVLALMIVPMVAVMARDSRRERLADVLEGFTADMAQESPSGVEEPGGEWAQSAARVEEMARLVDAEAGKALRAYASLLREMDSNEAAYFERAIPFVATNPYNFAGVSEREVLVERAANARAVSQAAEAYAAFLENTPRRFRTMLQAESVPPNVVDRMIGAFHTKALPSRRADLVRTDVAYHAAGAEMIEFLLNHWGRWTVTDEGWEDFDDDVDNGPYIEIVDRFNAAIDAEEQIAAEIDEQVRENLRDVEQAADRLRRER